MIWVAIIFSWPGAWVLRSKSAISQEDIMFLLTPLPSLSPLSPSLMAQFSPDGVCSGSVHILGYGSPFWSVTRVHSTGDTTVFQVAGASGSVSWSSSTPSISCDKFGVASGSFGEATSDACSSDTASQAGVVYHFQPQVLALAPWWLCRAPSWARISQHRQSVAVCNAHWRKWFYWFQGHEVYLSHPPLSSVTEFFLFLRVEGLMAATVLLLNCLALCVRVLRLCSFDDS